MDLNELFFRHQIALMREAGTDNRGERRRFRGIADGFAARIGTLQHSLGARATPIAPATPITKAAAL